MIQCNAYRNNKKNQDNNQADHFRPRSCCILIIQLSVAAIPPFLASLKDMVSLVISGPKEFILT